MDSGVECRSGGSSGGRGSAGKGEKTLSGGFGSVGFGGGRSETVKTFLNSGGIGGGFSRGGWAEDLVLVVGERNSYGGVN
ncbi:hypothetical protein A2U01_0019428 [Trifolium medium]|uniref:Uncharacterized protein n=1 Tax=Trifolium medium TaxID=97028 RepID=A0A392NEY4_9FABA|nr:hypothetical protein [Trifolium medium]